ncbi:hypothetical protein ABIE44_003296 [Marmoricola sp. OAE513]|uniref:hypothetical protein n=1 Tax=Marmoricola sp. OAE513 TaxID=2817894 RepID=UPI001AEA7A0A
MVKKALVLTAFTAGYVLGAKAGKERYEQIRSLFLKVKDNPTVQEKAHEAAHFAHDQGVALAEAVVHKVTPEPGIEQTGDLRPHGATAATAPGVDPFAVRI